MERVEELSGSQKKELTKLMVAFYVEKDDSKIHRLFELYDRDRNGSISASELRAVMKAISPDGVDEDAVQSMIEEADTNKNGQIEFEEFKIVMIARRDA